MVWFDALTQNVDRSWRNPNLLRWHGDPWLIDHGAALYFHHDWSAQKAAATRPYPTAKDHVLLPVASSLGDAHDLLAPRVTQSVLHDVLGLVPDEWLAGEAGFRDADDVRTAYADVLTRRLAARETWLDAVEVARADV